MGVDGAKSGLVARKDEKNNYTLHEEHSLPDLAGSAADSGELRVHQAVLAPLQTSIGPGGKIPSREHNTSLLVVS